MSRIKNTEQRVYNKNKLFEGLRSFYLMNGIFDEDPVDGYIRLLSEVRISPSIAKNAFATLSHKAKKINEQYDLNRRHSTVECNTAESLIYMANAYASRSCAFFLMLAGEISRKTANHLIGDNFCLAQLMTFGANKEFQRLSSHYSNELLYSGCDSLNLDGFKQYLKCVVTHQYEINFPYKTNEMINRASILSFFDDISDLPDLTPDALNAFIAKNKQRSFGY